MSSGTFCSCSAGSSSTSLTPLLPFPIPRSTKTLKIGLFPSQGCSGGGWMELSPSEFPTKCRIPADLTGSRIPPCLQSSGRGTGEARQAGGHETTPGQRGFEASAAPGRGLGINQIFKTPFYTFPSPAERDPSLRGSSGRATWDKSSSLERQEGWPWFPAGLSWDV